MARRKVLEEMYYAVYYWSEDDPDYRALEGLYTWRSEAEEAAEQIEYQEYDVLADVQEIQAGDEEEAYRVAASMADV